jgi:hypothetical protein
VVRSVIDINHSVIHHTIPSINVWRSDWGGGIITTCLTPLTLFQALELLMSVTLLTTCLTPLTLVRGPELLMSTTLLTTSLTPLTLVPMSLNKRLKYEIKTLSIKWNNIDLCTFAKFIFFTIICHKMPELLMSVTLLTTCLTPLTLVRAPVLLLVTLLTTCLTPLTLVCTPPGWLVSECHWHQQLGSSN